MVMNLKSFFLIASLQLITAFFVAAKIVQEVFLSNPNPLSDLWISPPVFALLAAAVLALIQNRAWFKLQPVFLAVSGAISVAGALCTIFAWGGFPFWLLVLAALSLVALLAAELFLSFYSKKLSIIILLFNLLFLAFLQIDWHVFFVTRAHVSLKILSVIWQDQALLMKAAKYLGVESRQILGETVFLVLLPLFLGGLLSLFSGKKQCARVKLPAVVVVVILVWVQYLLFYPVSQKTSLPEYIGMRISAGLLPLPLHPVLAASEKLESVLAKDVQIDLKKCYTPAKISYRSTEYEKIVLIGVESLRYDAFAELMPQTRKIAESGKLFTRHFANANITSSSFYSLFNFNFPVNLVFTPEKLKKSLLENVATDNGFETVLVKPEVIGTSTLDLWGQQKRTVFSKQAWTSTPDALKKTLEEMLKPGRKIVLTYIFNTHFNYYFPPEFEKFKPVCPEDTNIFVMWPSPENVTMIRNRYRNSVHYLDHCLNEFFAEVSQKRLDQRTLFVLFGDHGQSLRENGCLGHGTGADTRQYHVPLVVLGPNIEPEVIEKPTSHFNALAKALKPAGFEIIAPFAGLDGKFPILALEESVSGRILVIQHDYLNIFDLSKDNSLRWIALVSHNFTIDRQILQRWYQKPDQLAETVANDLEFIIKWIGA